MRIYAGIVAISLFWVDVPTSSERVGFRSKFSGSESDHHVELREVFGPSNLAMGQELRRHEIFQALVVGNNVDRRSRTFKVMSPYVEGLKDREEFLVVDVVVEFRSRECPGVKSDRMYFSVVQRDDGKDHCEGVVGSVGF
jgi:hypothetical protein